MWGWGTCTCLRTSGEIWQGVNTGRKLSFPVNLEGIPPLSKSFLLLVRQEQSNSHFFIGKPFSVEGFLGFSSLIFLKVQLDVSWDGSFIVYLGGFT